MEIPKNKPTRRLFYLVVVLLCMFLFIGRFVLVPVFYGTPIPDFRSMLDSLLGDLLVAVLVGVMLAVLLRWLLPEPRRPAAIEVVHANERGAKLDEARADTKEWWFSGGLGRYTRAVTLPELAKQARESNTTKAIYIQVLDPRDGELCERYADYRRTVRTGRRDPDWSTQRVRQEVLATVISAYAWGRADRLDVTVALKRTMSLFRFDLSSQLLVITKEDPTEPALACSAGTIFYEAFHEELRTSLDQADVLRRDVRGIALEELDVSSARRLLNQLGLKLSDGSDDELTSIVEIVKNAHNPYA